MAESAPTRAMFKAGSILNSDIVRRKRLDGFQLKTISVCRIHTLYDRAWHHVYTPCKLIAKSTDIFNEDYFIAYRERRCREASVLTIGGQEGKRYFSVFGAVEDFKVGRSRNGLTGIASIRMVVSLDVLKQVVPSRFTVAWSDFGTPRNECRNIHIAVRSPT